MRDAKSGLDSAEIVVRRRASGAEKIKRKRALDRALQTAST